MVSTVVFAVAILWQNVGRRLRLVRGHDGLSVLDVDRDQLVIFIVMVKVSRYLDGADLFIAFVKVLLNNSLQFLLSLSWYLFIGLTSYQRYRLITADNLMRGVINDFVINDLLCWCINNRKVKILVGVLRRNRLLIRILASDSWRINFIKVAVVNWCTNNCFFTGNLLSFVEGGV